VCEYEDGCVFYVGVDLVPVGPRDEFVLFCAIDLFWGSGWRGIGEIISFPCHGYESDVSLQIISCFMVCGMRESPAVIGHQ